MGDKTGSWGARPVSAVTPVVPARLKEGVPQLRGPSGAPLGRNADIVSGFGSTAVSLPAWSGRARLFVAALRLRHPAERLLEARESELPGQRALFMSSFMSSPHSGPPYLYRYTRSVL